MKTLSSPVFLAHSLRPPLKAPSIRVTVQNDFFMSDKKTVSLSRDSLAAGALSRHHRPFYKHGGMDRMDWKETKKGTEKIRKASEHDQLQQIHIRRWLPSKVQAIRQCFMNNIPEKLPKLSLGENVISCLNASKSLVQGAGQAILGWYK